MRAKASLEHKRRGLTLVELCLVLALLVVVGSFAAPVMNGAMDRRALRSGGDLLRGAWARARLAAMQSGHIYVFRYEPNGSRYDVRPLGDLAAGTVDALVPDNSTGQNPSDILRVRKARLPGSVRFMNGEVASSNLVLAMMPAEAEGPWSPPIVFNPDGTASDASVVLVNEQQQTIRVTLRGLTGLSGVGDIGSEAAPL